MTRTDNRGINTAPPALGFLAGEPAFHQLALSDLTESGEVKEPKKRQTGSPGNSVNTWKVFVFFLPGKSGAPKPPKLPNGKHWLELLLMLLKIAGAVWALVKAAGVLS